MLESILEQLYHTMVRARLEELCACPCYQEALDFWKAKKDGSPIDQEDGANQREYAWGLLAFTAGLSMGLRLGLEIAAFPAAGDS